MKKALFLLLIFPLFLIASFKDSLTKEEKIWLDNQKVITVGAMDNWEPINFVDYKNQPSGIGASIVEILNKKLDNKLQIVSSSWSDIYEKTKAGELNAILDITPKKEREEFFLFTKAYLQIPHVIVSKIEQKPFLSLVDLNEKVVALEKDVGTIIDLEKNFPNIKIKIFENTTLALDAVSRGIADAYVGNRAVVDYKMRNELLSNLKVDNIDITRKPALLTIGISKQYPLLFSILQKAIDEISLEEINKIYSKWSKEKIIDIGLTKEEKNYLTKKGKLKFVTSDDSWAPYLFIDNKNSVNGLEIDFFNLLESRLRVPIELEHKIWSEALEDARKHKYDGIFPATPTTERKKDLLFSNPYYISSIAMVTNNNLGDFNENSFSGKKIALFKDSFVKEFIEQRIKNAKIVEIEGGIKELLNTLTNGEVDAIADYTAALNFGIKENRLEDKIKISKVFNSDDLTGSNYGTTNKEPLLNSIINKAIASFTKEEIETIKTRWEGILPLVLKKNEKLIFLTQEEEIWLKEHPVIKYAGDPSYMPFESFDFNGNYIGIVANHLNFIEENLGIKFEILKTNSWRETLDFVKTNKVDMFSNYVGVEDFSDTHVTVPMDIESPIVVVGKRDENQDFIVSLSQLKGKKIAVIKDYFYLKEIYKQFPNMNYIEVDNAQVALNGVSLGIYDVALCSLPVATYNINQGLSNIEIIGKTDTFMQLGFSIRKDYETLSKIIEKVLIYHVNSEFNEVIKDWQKVTKESEINWDTIFKALLIIFFMILFLVLWNYQLKKQVNKKTYELSKLLKFFDENVIASRTDLEGNITYVSDAFCKISGNSREFMLGKNHRIGKHLDNDPKIYKDMWETIIDGKTWKGRIKNKTKDGGYYWVDSIIEQEKDNHGNVIGYLSIRHDVTAQVELEKLSANLENIIKDRTLELYQMNQKQKAIFDTASIGIVLVKDRVINELNNKVCTIFGYEYDELLNQSTRIFYLNDDDYNRVKEEYKTLEKDNKVISWEQKFLRKNGSSFWARISIQAVDFMDLKKGAVAVIDDITLEKKALEDIKKAKDLAEESTKSKSEFLANMSHEIRTPMNAIIGMAYLALQTNLDEQQKNYIQKIDKASKNLLGIINDILDFSKIEAGKMHFEKIDFSLDDILANISSLFTFQTQEKGLELLFDIDTTLPLALKGDVLRLNQVLTNLLSNAIKFTSKGEIILSIKQLSKNENEVEIRFDVKDSGIGISDEQKTKLFNSFSQADNSTTRKYGGTGLGLAISKQIVELMGGSVGLESKVGVGSDFYFILKFDLQEKQKNLDLMENDINNLKVLIVDDNASSREILENIIKSLKFEVKALCCGKESIVELKEAYSKDEPYNLVLMDWKMPDLDGIETINRINEEIKEIPAFIMVTAYDRDELIEKAKEVKILGFLEKPISPSTLYDTILKSFGKEIVKNVNEVKQNINFDEVKALVNGAKVLLVEDNLQNQEIATEFLKKANINIVIANNGKEAVDILNENEEFDAILMDCQMPIMDGYEATKHIREIEKFANLPIIAMTANAMQGDKEKCISVGMNDYISKPLDFNKFYETLGKWVKLKNPIQKVAEKIQVEDINIDNLKIEGIDINEALARMAGNKKLFLTQLERFVKSQEDFKTRIVDEDLEVAIREAHTLKGLCGNIGANSLFDKAKELEYHLKEKGFDNSSFLLIQILNEELEELVIKIKEQLNIFGLEKENESLDNLEIDEEKVSKLINELQDLLDELDSDAIIKANELKNELSKTLHDEKLDRLMSSINNFDFDKASEILETIK